MLKTRGKKLKKRSFTKHWAIKLLSIRVSNSSVFCKEGKLCALNYVLLIQLIVLSVLKLGNDFIENQKEFILLLMPSGVLDIVDVFLEIVMEI